LAYDQQSFGTFSEATLGNHQADSQVPRHLDGSELYLLDRRGCIVKLG
jgi:hypothetical protein